MDNNGLFHLKYKDGTQFVGNLFEKDWSKLEDSKRITEIIFSFAKKRVKMQDFKEYNLTFETHMITGQSPRIVNVTLAGRAENHSVLLIFDCRTGKIIRKEVEVGKEYQWICATWKKGIITGIPKTYYG